jgi:hypothetical protein
MVSRYHVCVILHSIHINVYYFVVLCKDSMSFSHYVFMRNDSTKQEWMLQTATGR